MVGPSVGIPTGHLCMIQSYFPVVRGRIHGALAPLHDISPSPPSMTSSQPTPCALAPTGARHSGLRSQQKAVGRNQAGRRLCSLTKHVVRDLHGAWLEHVYGAPRIRWARGPRCPNLRVLGCRLPERSKCAGSASSTARTDPCCDNYCTLLCNPCRRTHAEGRRTERCGSSTHA